MSDHDRNESGLNRRDFMGAGASLGLAGGSARLADNPTLPNAPYNVSD